MGFPNQPVYPNVVFHDSFPLIITKPPPKKTGFQSSSHHLPIFVGPLHSQWVERWSNAASNGPRPYERMEPWVKWSWDRSTRCFQTFSGRKLSGKPHSTNPENIFEIKRLVNFNVEWLHTKWNSLNILSYIYMNSDDRKAGFNLFIRILVMGFGLHSLGLDYVCNIWTIGSFDWTNGVNPKK